MRLTIAYVEEPLFGWTDANQLATGADIELAEAILRAIGVTKINYQGSHALLDAFNQQLRTYLRSDDHRRRTLRFGLA